MNHRTRDTKPFLLLSTRVEDSVAREEMMSFARAGRLSPDDLHQVRAERHRPQLDFGDYSAVIVGGSPFNTSDVDKTPVQRQVEAWLGGVIDEVLDREIPFFGACYGVGLLGTARGGRIGRKFGETAAAVEVTVTAAGREDPVLAGLPTQFSALVGHKEACEELPPGAELLVRGEACPVQMFRLGSNAYATQFHPELDVESFHERLKLYHSNGYFSPGADEAIVAEARRRNVAISEKVLANFVSTFRAPVRARHFGSAA